MASSSDGKEVKSVLDSKSMNENKKQPQANMKANNSTVGIEFQQLLNSILEQKPPISKEKMGNIVKEAQKSVKHYKHIVYFVEVFIKKVSIYSLFFLFSNRLYRFTIQVSVKLQTVWSLHNRRFDTKFQT